MDEPTFTAYLTAHALTSGIKTVQAQRCPDINPSMISFKAGNYTNCAHKEGLDWHLTEEGALARAGEMRIMKIASLKKQIYRLETLRIKVIE